MSATRQQWDGTDNQLGHYHNDDDNISDVQKTTVITATMKDDDDDNNQSEHNTNANNDNTEAGNDGHVGFPAVVFHEMRHRSSDGHASHCVSQEWLET